MRIELRTIVLTGIGVVFLMVLAEANHYLALFHLHIYAAGLLLTFPLLRLRFKQGLVFTCLIAFFHDVASPMPFGASFIPFVLAHTFTYSLRSHFRREEPTTGTVFALLLNTILFLGFALQGMREAPLQGLFWQRLLVDGILSQLLVIFIAGWYFSLQNEALRFFGIFLDQEQRQAD